MRTRRTPAPRPPRISRLHRLAAAALSLPLALGALSATALPAAAGDATAASIVHTGTATVGEATTATFSCLDDPQHPVEAAGWYTNEQDTVLVANPTPGQGTFTFTRDVVFTSTMFSMVGLTCTYVDGSDPSTTNVLVNVTEALLVTDSTVSVLSASVGPHDPIRASATVTTSGSPVTEGVVQFSIDGAWTGSEMPVDVSGTAVLDIPNPGAGHHEVTARYSEGWTYAASTAAAATVWVKGDPTLALAVPSLAHTPDVVLRATVAGVAGLPAPTGTVTFRHGVGTDLGTAPLVDGEAVLPLPGLATGTYDVVGVYSGDTSYADATSSPSIMTVEPAIVAPQPVPPVVTVPSAVTTTVATPATLTVGLPSAHRPTGTITVSSASGLLLEVAVPVSGNLTLTLPVLAPGTHDVVVRTAASATVEATEHTVRVTVTGEPATGSPAPDADLAGSTSTLTSGEEITLVARGFLPDETVAFYLHSDPIFLGTAVADLSGVARLTVALPAGTPLGQHHVQATGGTSLRWAEIPVTVTAQTPVLVAPASQPVVALPGATRVPTSVAALPSAFVPAATAPLAATGADLRSTALLVSILLGAGALLLVVGRRSGHRAG